MPLDPSTLCARTTAGDAELAAPRNGLAIAQRRLLTLLDKPVALDELAGRPGLQPDRLERDLARLAEHGLIEIHRPPGATGPMFPTTRRLGPMIELPPPPTVTQGPATSLRADSPSAGGPVVAGRRVRHGRAIVVGFAALAAVGVAIWLFSAPSPEPPPRATPAPRPPTATPPPARGQAALADAPASAKSIEQVRALLVPDPVPVRTPAVVTTPGPAPSVASSSAAPIVLPEVAPPTMREAAPALNASQAATLPRPATPPAAEPTAPPVRVASAAPLSLETRIAPLTLTPVTREVPDFPREALAAGVDRGRVKARVTVDAAGRVSAVDVVESEPQRVFDRAVMRSLARWTFAPGEGGRTTVVEIAFRRE